LNGREPIRAYRLRRQTGILVGFYFVSAKLGRQADEAIDVTRKLLGPLQSAVENLKAVTARIAEFSASTRWWWRRSA